MLTNLTNITNYLTTILKYIIVAVVSFLLGYGYYAYFYNPTTDSDPTESINDSKKTPKTPEEIHETTHVTIKEKQKDTDPDLVVNNRYIAEVQGKTYEIPKVAKGDQTTITSDINMTPIVRKVADLEYKRNWEVSTGIGRSHDGHFYVPIGIQRNYNYDRAIEVSVGVAKDHVENIQVTHKWKF